jgi:putative inorganic carbon (hco3(-)) transporter
MREVRNRPVAPNPFQVFLYKAFLSEKLNNWVGLLLVTVIAALFAFLLSTDLVLGLEVLAAVIGVSILFICLFSATAGLYIIMLYTFSASAISRFFLNDKLPVGVLIDVLVFATFLGLFFSNDKLKENARRFFKSRPVILYSVIVAFLTLELANPIGHSFGGWLQVMRKVFESFLIVFIAYNVFDSVTKMKTFIKLLFFFTLILALYGCFQQWHGLLQSEINWVNSDELRYGLIAIWGEYRKFSLLGGPTEFGIVMAACALFFMLIGLNEKNVRDKVIYVAGAVFMVLGMSYSGTRTANAMFAGGIVLFLLLTINRKMSRFLAIAAVFAFLFVMYAPIYSSATLLRFRSTFSATQDASYNVRETNRRSVQPFIWSHPVGGGLSTTGAMGQRYNPANPNAGFPTDSSYLNKALESGWIGMFLTCLFYFSMLQYTLRGYFLATKDKYKSWFAAATAFFFSFFLGEMTQEAVGVISNMAIYFPIFALVLRLREFSEGAVSRSSTV